MNNLTTEEKIDYIYETLKSQKRRDVISGIFRWGRRLFVIGSLVYFYFYGAQLIQSQMQAILKSNTMDSLFNSESISKIKGLIEKNSKPSASSGSQY